MVYQIEVTGTGYVGLPMVCNVRRGIISWIV